MKIANLAEARRVPAAGHVIPEVHAYLLAAASNGHLVEFMLRSESTFKTRLDLGPGHFLAPQWPSLGVELDEAACER